MRISELSKLEVLLKLHFFFELTWYEIFQWKQHTDPRHLQITSPIGLKPIAEETTGGMLNRLVHRHPGGCRKWFTDSLISVLIHNHKQTFHNTMTHIVTRQYARYLYLLILKLVSKTQTSRKRLVDICRPKNEKIWLSA